jgi:lysozyme family protein
MTKEQLINKTISEYEGGYSNDSEDPGGETHFGISKEHNPDVDIKNLTKDGAIELYTNKEWSILKCEKIASMKVRWKLFDQGVNLGTGRAAMFLQRAVGVKDDGIIGNETIQKTNLITTSSTGEHTVLSKMVKQQVLHYAKKIQEKPFKVKYIIGWMNRAFDVGENLG